MPDADDVTPRDGRSPMEWILEEIKATREASETAANAALETHSAVKAQGVILDDHGQRITRLEVTSIWFPTAISLVALATAILALVR